MLSLAPRHRIRSKKYEFPWIPIGKCSKNTQYQIHILGFAFSLVCGGGGSFLFCFVLECPGINRKQNQLWLSTKHEWRICNESKFDLNASVILSKI